MLRNLGYRISSSKCYSSSLFPQIDIIQGTSAQFRIKKSGRKELISQVYSSQLVHWEEVHLQ